MLLTVENVSERPVELLRQLIRYDTTNPLRVELPDHLEVIFRNLRLC